MNELCAKAVAIAETQVGVREERRNRGRVVDQYSIDIGRDPTKADPWCCIFVCAMFKRAANALGVKCPVPMTAGCWTIDEKSPKAVKTRTPVPGAIFLTNGHKHTGIVTAVHDNGTVSCLEGNTSAGGSPEGDGVYARTRRVNEIELYLDFNRVELEPL